MSQQLPRDSDPTSCCRQHDPHSSQLSPSQRSTIVLVAKWLAFTPRSKKRQGFRKSHLYTLVSWPTAQLYEGARVRLLALSTPTHRASLPGRSFQSYDPHVLGSVTRIVEKPNGRAKATIVNECAKNTVHAVELTFPNVPAVVRGARPLDKSKTFPSHALASRTTKLVELHRVAPPPWRDECVGGLCRRSEFDDHDLVPCADEDDWLDEGDEGHHADVLEKRATSIPDIHSSGQNGLSRMAMCGWMT